MITMHPAFIESSHVNDTDALTANITNSPHGEYAEIPIAFWTFLSLETLVIILANGMFCWLFLNNRKLRTQQNYFVLSLSVSDLLVGLTIAPCEYCALKNDLNSSVECPIFCGSVVSFNMLASIMNLILIAADRFYSIRMPFKYQEKLTKRRALLIIIFAWLTTFFMTVMPLSWMLHPNLSPEKKFKINYVFTMSLFVFVLTGGIGVAFIYYSIVRTVRAKLRSARERNSNPAGIKVCILVAISFFVCWIPTCIVEMLLQVQQETVIPRSVSNATYFIMLINPCLDPIMYAYYRRDFRQELLAWSQRQWKLGKRVYNRLFTTTFGERQNMTSANYKYNNNHSISSHGDAVHTKVCTEHVYFGENNLLVTDRVSAL